MLLFLRTLGVDYRGPRARHEPARPLYRIVTISHHIISCRIVAIML